ncbi:B3 domain-containing protein LOC_Os12g40090-like [Carex rostrata]
MDFRKEMTGFYMHSVCLPEKVTKRFDDLVGENLEFQCPSGDVWHVGLIRSGDKLVLQPGWSNFVSSNNVSQNDILLFKLMSGSTFKVRILNSIGHEKNGSLGGGANAVFIEKAVDIKVEEGSMIQSSSKIKRVTRGYNTSTEKSRSNPCPRKRSPCQNQSSLPVKKRLKLDGQRFLCQEEKEVCEEDEFDESEVEEETLEEARRTALLVMEHQALLRRKMGLLKNDDPSKTKTQKHSNSDVPVGYAYAPQNWRAMSAKQKTRANFLALKIQTGNPIFLHALQQSCLTKKSCVAVPKDFSAKHLPKGNQTFVLHRPEKENTWSVRYYFRKTHQSIEGSSWLKFVQENNLREGDICMFELVNSAHQIAFRVHVAQAT